MKIVHSLFNRKNHLAVFCLLISVLYLGRTSVAQQYNFTNFSVENGLSNSAVVAMYQDSKGYLWFCTYGGLSRFDGKTFKRFTDKDGLAGNYVSAIAEDTSGNIWIGTNRGLSRYRNSSFTNFTYSDGLPNNQIWSLYIDQKGILWIGTTAGVSKYDPANKTAAGKSFENIKVSSVFDKNTIRCIVQDRDENFWFGTTNGVVKYDGDTFVTVRSDGTCNDLALDSKGNIWMAGWGLSIEKYDPSAAPGQNTTNYEYVINNPCNAVLQDKKGNIWAGSWEKGVFRYDGQNFFNFTTKQGLTINSTWSLLEDREGNIWVGTFGGGVCKFNGERFVYFNEESGLVNNAVSGIIEDRNGNIWFSTEVGISKYDPVAAGKGEAGISNFTSVNGETISKLTSLVEDSMGTIWFSSYGARGYKYRDGKFIQAEIGDHFLYKDHLGSIWSGSDGGGAYKFSGDTIVPYIIGTDHNMNRILYIYEDRKGNMWFGCYSGGVNVLYGSSLKHISAKNVLSERNLRFTDKMVFGIAEDEKGRLWMGTDGDGIYVCEYLPEGKLKIIDVFTTKDGLVNDLIGSLVFDDGGYLWAGTSEGISRINVNHYNKTGKKIFRNYGLSDGFRGLECSKAVYKDRYGNIWFGTSKGAIRYNPKADQINNTEPNTHITGINLFFGEEDLSPFCDSIHPTEGLPVQLSLPYNKNHLTFEFIGISLTAPEKVSYQWKLENFDENWSPVSKKQEVTYSNIPSGEFVFMVRASNGDGVWNKQPVKFGFVIIPPFWKTWWFYLLSSLTVSALVYGFIKMRERNLQREKKILEHKVKIRTAEVMEQKQIIEEKNKDILDSINYAKGIQQSILPREDEFKKLLPESFVLFKPKDIVSGDFYWIGSPSPTLPPPEADKRGKGEPAHGLPKYQTARNSSYNLLKQLQEERKKHTTETEQILWKYLKGKKLEEYKFRRQHIIDEFIVDFICLSKKLILEIDGKYHDTPEMTEADNLRTEILQSLGYKIIRFKNEEVIGDIDNVLHKINNELLASPRVSTPFPSGRAGDGLLVLFAACDCTGHGVPGAFMSMMCTSFLNEVVTKRGISKPAEILDAVRKEIITTLKQRGHIGEQKDGMDAALCAWNKETNMLEYSGANNPVWHLRNGEFTEFKPDRQPVGYSSEDAKNFTNHSFQLQKGDMIYVSSDGYADQFGGLKGKKFKSSQLKEILLSIHQKPMEEQQDILNNAIDEWRGNLEQVDDICVIGVRV